MSEPQLRLVEQGEVGTDALVEFVHRRVPTAKSPCLELRYQSQGFGSTSAKG